MNVTVERAATLSDEEAAALNAIYRDSFPPAERVDFSELRAAFCAGRSRLYLARAGQRLAGFAFLAPLSGTRIGLLEYLAVDRARRASGIGGQLLRFIVEDLRASPSPRPGILLEVEPAEVDDPGERELRRRRMAFYRRHGARPVACAPRYRAPNQAGAEPVPMSLMWLPLQTSMEDLSGDVLRQCLREVYTEGWGLPADHPLIGEALRGLTC